MRVVSTLIAPITLAALTVLMVTNGGCSAILDFSGSLVDAGPQPDAALFDADTTDADPTAPDAGPDPRTLFEPNNTFAEAATIVPGSYGPIAIYNVGDHDFYKFTLAALQDVTITVEFLQTDGDLDLKLYDAAFTLIPPSSEGFMSNEQIVHTTATNGQIGPGDFYIEVYGYNNVYINERYQLILTVP